MLLNVLTKPHHKFFRFAIARDIASRNPAADFKPRDILAEARNENRARVDAKELPELLAKMDDYNGDAITRFAMKLMAYTFVRTSEEIEAPWEEFDLDGARWTIPPERMKMNTSHIVPLSRQALEVLRALKLLTGNGQTCVSRSQQQEEAHEQQHNPLCALSAWVSRPYDRTWFPWTGIDHTE
jgi:integrase